jgi:hypothetical protein
VSVNSGNARRIEMLEKSITNAILRYLRNIPGCFCWKQHGGQYGTSGLPDIICCLDGRFVAFEVKRPSGGRLTKLQARALEKIQAAGGIAAMVTSLDEVKEITRKMLEDRNCEKS